MILINNTKLALLVLFIFLVLGICCQPNSKLEESNIENLTQKVITGADQLDQYLPLLANKKVALLVNHTSVIDKKHLLDTLLAENINVIKIFSPEHGFRGDVSDGLKINNSRDPKTGLPIISLYGQHKKPSREDLEDIDVVIYDIQDVGTRFYTYISAMHYMMNACSENEVEMMILDRPNPNGHYVDGPVLDLELKSYVGMHPIPIIYGMTVGELAQLIVGEKLLESNKPLNLNIIKLQNWNHNTRYSLPVKPSPNLPNDQSTSLYPSLCLFEGTKISVGRGTNNAFQVIGAPDSTLGEFEFTPISIPNMSKYPPYENQKCYGKDLRNVKVKAELDLNYILDFYKKYSDKDIFFNAYFKKLAGTNSLQKQIQLGLSAVEIRKSWQDELLIFKTKRKKYLLYKDFY